MKSVRPEWEVRAYGNPLAHIDADLMAHIVIMLGRELITESDHQSTADTTT